MPIVTAVKLGFFNYVNYKGRARRADFWWWVLASRLGQLVASGIGDAVGTLFFCAVLLPSIMFGIRRMHDVNKSGWWVLIPVAPFMSVFFIDQLSFRLVSFLLFFAIIAMILNIIFWAQPSDAGVNRFGPPAPPANF